jgi:hypothetical protein
MRDVDSRGGGVYLRVDLPAVHHRHGLTGTDAIANLNGDSGQRARHLRKNRDTGLRHQIAGDLQRRFERGGADGQRGNIDAVLGDRCACGGCGLRAATGRQRQRQSAEKDENRDGMVDATTHGSVSHAKPRGRS